MRTCFLPALLLLTCASVFADGGQAVPATIHMKDASTLRGTIRKERLAFTAGFGDISVPSALLAEIAFDQQASAKVRFRNGDVLSVRVNEDTLPIESMLGNRSLSVTTIQRIVFSRPPTASQEGLVFSCGFDTIEGIKACLPDRPDNPIRSELVEGTNGKALLINGEFNILLAELPPNDVPIEAGCVEFWAKFNDPSQRFWETSFFVLRSDLPYKMRYIDLCLVPHDWGGYRGLFGRAYGFHTGNGSLKNTLERNPNGWHHYAIVWNIHGIDSLAVNGVTPKSATFIDGILYASAPELPYYAGPQIWNTPYDKDKESAVSLFLLPRQTPLHDGFMQPKSLTFDEFRIWSFAKTEFDLPEPAPAPKELEW